MPNNRVSQQQQQGAETWRLTVGIEVVVFCPVRYLGIWLEERI